jgi:hypothetical protein
MDINLPQTSKKPPSVATGSIQLLNLKLNQQLDVKIISSTIETQKITLQIAQPKRSILVKSNLPIETTPGQALKVLVTKLSPAAEFKVISADLDKQIDLKNLTLKQIVLQPGNVKNSHNKAFLQTSVPSVITAKIISINNDKVLLKLPDFKTPEQVNYLQKNALQHHNSIIQLSRQQLTQKYLPGQKIQLEVSKKGAELDFKILDPKPLKLKNGQIIPATVIQIKNHKLQIQLPTLSQPITLKKNQLLHSDSASKVTHSSEPKLQIVNFQHLKKGQQINLEVIKVGGHPEFKLLANHSSSEQLIQQAFKQNLPNQQQPSVLLNQIIQLLPSINKSTNIPDTLKRLAKEILDSLPHKNIQKPSQLKIAISNSGLFLEAKLAKTDQQGNLTIHPDFKNKLFKFNHALKHSLSSEQKLSANEANLIKELLQKSENSLAKVILNQLASLPKEDTSRQVWLLDLPFLNKEIAESVEIKISQEQKHKEDDRRENWAVTITISPPGLSTIYCKVSCFDETINTTFWSNTQDVVAKINQNLDYLKSQFETAGINPGHMSAQTGTPPLETHQHISKEDSPLVNQKV